MKPCHAKMTCDTKMALEEETRNNQAAPINKGTFTCSDGFLNLLCWFTVYPSRFFAMFFRQLCLCGCAVSKTLNRNGVQTVYCCPECHEGNDYHPKWWDMDRNENEYWICCEPRFTDHKVFMSNLCGHCLDHVHYVSKYNSIMLSMGACLLWISTSLFIKLPGIIIYVVAIILLFLIVILLVVTGVVVITPFIPLILLGFLIVVLCQCASASNRQQQPNL